MINTALPPTVNELDEAQRARLTLYTRKLSQVLGSTPFLVEPYSTLSHPPLGYKHEKEHKLPRHIRALRRQGFYHSPSSSVSSIESFTGIDVTILSETDSDSLDIHATTPKEAAYVQAIPPHHGAPSRSRSKAKAEAARLPMIKLCPNPERSLHTRLNSLPSPHSPRFLSSHRRTGSTPPTPTTPNLFPVVDGPAEMRRRAAKLQRTLGEGVPPELISRSSSPMPFESDGLPPPAPLKTFGPKTKLLPTRSHSKGRKAYRRRSNTISHTHRRPSIPQFHLALPLDAPFAVLASPTQSSSRPVTPSHESMLQQCDDLELALEGALRIIHHEWTGEWNIEDMDQVLKGLRALKL